MDRISVAMASFNGSAYIEAQILSILNQTRRVDELVVSDDCSTDDTLARISEITKNTHLEVKILRNEKKLWPHGNFERALSATTGDYIFLCDQDDVWREDKVAKMVDIMKEQRTLGAISDFWVCDAELNPVGNYVALNPHVQMDIRRHIHGCATVLTRPLLELALPMDDVGSREIWFDIWINRLADGLGSRSFMSEPLHFWRRHDLAWSGIDQTPDAGPSTSRPRLLSKLKSLRAKIGSASDQLKFIALQIRIQESILDRLSSRGDALNEFRDSFSFNADDSRVRLERDRLLERRSVLTTKNWLARLLRIIKLFAASGYHRYGGARSALLDLFRHP
jgi:glycosyltransferase involved in cell wall biosynthesis